MLYFPFFQKYEDYYNTEEDINAKLNIFSVNMQMAYGGVNNVHTQIGYASDKGTWIMVCERCALAGQSSQGWRDIHYLLIIVSGMVMHVKDTCGKGTSTVCQQYTH